MALVCWGGGGGGFTRCACNEQVEVKDGVLGRMEEEWEGIKAPFPSCCVSVYSLHLSPHFPPLSVSLSRLIPEVWWECVSLSLLTRSLPPPHHHHPHSTLSLLCFFLLPYSLSYYPLPSFIPLPPSSRSFEPSQHLPSTF